LTGTFNLLYKDPKPVPFLSVTITLNSGTPDQKKLYTKEVRISHSIADKYLKYDYNEYINSIKTTLNYKDTINWLKTTNYLSDSDIVSTGVYAYFTIDIEQNVTIIHLTDNTFEIYENKKYEQGRVVVPLQDSSFPIPMNLNYKKNGYIIFILSPESNISLKSSFTENLENLSKIVLEKKSCKVIINQYVF
jgi:hypothetical protein